MEVSFIETDDSDPNLMGLLPNLYHSFIVPSSEPQLLQYSASLEYENDRDYFLVNITEKGNYKLSYAGDVNAYLIDEEGTMTRWKDNETLEIEVGTYYILIQSSSEDRESYSFTISN